MMMNEQDTPPKPPNLNGNDMCQTGVMGKNPACNDEKQSGYPATPQPTVNGSNDVSFRGHGEDGNLIIIEAICCAGETGPLCWREPIQQELPSLHSLWAATVCYCGTAKCQCCHELQIWMKIEST